MANNNKGSRTVNVANPSIDTNELAALMARMNQLEAENQALKEKQEAKRVFTLRVSEKGALSAYGLGRFPVTLYRQQWEFLLDHATDIKAFIKANSAKLAVKE